MHYPTRLRVQGEWLPPRDDIDSPDLYIPGIYLSSWLSQGINLPRIVMAIVTYILLTALHSGIHARFYPQVCDFPTTTIQKPHVTSSDSR
jgi:protein transport protein YIF1